MKMSWLVICALPLMACVGGPYVYRPAEQATVTVQGQTAARYPIPPESPRGDVRVASFGIAKMDLRGDDGGNERTAMLQVRMVVSNDSDEDWRVDTRQLAVTLPSVATIKPAYVNTDQGGLPDVVAPPHSQRTVDLYFPLPESLRGARDVPEFDFSWAVQTPERVIARRTPFERFEVDDTPSIGYAGSIGYGPIWDGPLGWGRVWWYDPLYVGPPVVVRTHVPVIVRQPRPLHFGRPPMIMRRR